jgi:hypothetical protein
MIMADPGGETCKILQGPDGGIYCISDKNLEEHRLRGDVAAAVRKVYEQSGTAPPTPQATEFQIIGKGPVVRRPGMANPTPDSHWDMYA